MGRRRCSLIHLEAALPAPLPGPNVVGLVAAVTLCVCLSPQMDPEPRPKKCSNHVMLPTKKVRSRARWTKCRQKGCRVFFSFLSFCFLRGATHALLNPRICGAVTDFRIQCHEETRWANFLAVLPAHPPPPTAPLRPLVRQSIGTPTAPCRPLAGVETRRI